MTKSYSVVFEIQVDADSPLEAAKCVQNMIQEGDDWQFYVQDEESKEIYSVDLQEEDEDAVLEVDMYKPIIFK